MATKKVMCATPDCRGVVAHQITGKTFQLRRGNQEVTMTGYNWSGMATCPLVPEHGQTSVVVTDGQVDESALRYKQSEDDDTELSDEVHADNDSDDV